MLKYNDSCVATLDSNQIERIIHVHYIFKITTCTCRYMTVEGGGGGVEYDMGNGLPENNTFKQF